MTTRITSTQVKYTTYMGEARDAKFSEYRDAARHAEAMERLLCRDIEIIIGTVNEFGFDFIPTPCIKASSLESAQ
jgi:hypothetical protein